MSSDLTISPLGLKLIKAYEGFTTRPKRLITGQFVVGYGHVISAEQVEAFELDPLTRQRAEALLRKDVKSCEIMVLEGVLAPLSQNQFDALCCLAFNIGEEKFLNSNVRHALNNGRILDAANSFDEWRKAEIGGYVYVIDVLMRRRTAEKALFLRGSHHRPGTGRYSLEALPDDSVVSISEEEHYFDPDSGIVDQVPYEASPNPARRREDSPLGFFGLSEVEYDEAQGDIERAQKSKVGTSKRSVFDPITRSDLIEAEEVSDPDLESSLSSGADRAIAHEANFEADTRIFEDDDDAVIQIEEYDQAPLVLENKISENHVASAEDDIAMDIPRIDTTASSERASFADDQDNDQREKGDVQEELLLTPQERQTPSPIAVAAAEVSDRLDALIDKSKLEADPPKVGIGVSEKPLSETVSNTLSGGENIVGLAAANDAAKPAAEKKAAQVNDATHADSASAYIQKGAMFELAQNNEEKGLGAYALMMIIGGCLLAGGLVTWLTNKTGLDDLTSLLVPLSIFIGAIMILGALYYMLRRKLRRS